jgi:hypothetical protein
VHEPQDAERQHLVASRHAAPPLRPFGGLDALTGSSVVVDGTGRLTHIGPNLPESPSETHTTREVSEAYAAPSHRLGGELVR